MRLARRYSRTTNIESIWYNVKSKDATAENGLARILCLNEVNSVSTFHGWRSRKDQVPSNGSTAVSIMNHCSKTFSCDNTAIPVRKWDHGGITSKECVSKRANTKSVRKKYTTVTTHPMIWCRNSQKKAKSQSCNEILRTRQVSFLASRAVSGQKTVNTVDRRNEKAETLQCAYCHMTVQWCWYCRATTVQSYAGSEPRTDGILYSTSILTMCTTVQSKERKIWKNKFLIFKFFSSYLRAGTRR